MLFKVSDLERGQSKGKKGLWILSLVKNHELRMWELRKRLNFRCTFTEGPVVVLQAFLV